MFVDLKIDSEFGKYIFSLPTKYYDFLPKAVILVILWISCTKEILDVKLLRLKK